MTDPTPEQIAKLPKWARAYISQLEDTADAATRQLEGYLDDQTPSQIWYDDWCRLGSINHTLRRYVQSFRVEVEHKGVALSVHCVGERGLELGWRPSGSRSGIGRLCFTPTSFQQASIINLAYQPSEYERLLDQRERAEKDTD